MRYINLRLIYLLIYLLTYFNTVCNRSASVDRLLDLASLLTANNLNANSIPQLRDLLRGIHIRLLDNFNQVSTFFDYLRSKFSMFSHGI